MFRTIQVYKIHLHKVLRQQLNSSVKRVFQTDYIHFPFLYVSHFRELMFRFITVLMLF